MTSAWAGARGWVGKFLSNKSTKLVACPVVFTIFPQRFQVTSCCRMYSCRNKLLSLHHYLLCSEICRGGMVETDLQYELVYHTLHHYWTTRTGSDDDDTRDIALEAIFDE